MCTADTSRQRKSYFLPVDHRISCPTDEINRNTNLHGPCWNRLYLIQHLCSFPGEGRGYDTRLSRLANGLRSICPQRRKARPHCASRPIGALREAFEYNVCVDKGNLLGWVAINEAHRFNCPLILALVHQK